MYENLAKIQIQERIQEGLEGQWLARNRKTNKQNAKFAAGGILLLIFVLMSSIGLSSY